MNLSEVIAPSFYEVHKAIKEHKYTHYLLGGGRGSTKSSFVGIQKIIGIVKDPNANGVALRKVKDTLKDSVYEQLCWAIEILGLSQYWHKSISPLCLTYTPTGQKILFRGADDPKKIKSIKFSKGYCKFIWYEEVDEFNGMEEIRMINQSLMRGGKEFVVFYSYNPPKSSGSWVNLEAKLTHEDRLVHHSNYLTVPREWLGEQFFIEAEHLKATKPKSYAHEYLGEVTGTGGEIFENVQCRPISQEEIDSFTNVKRGLDFGYAIDPFSYNVVHYDRKHKRLFVFYELYAAGLSNRKATDDIIRENRLNDLVMADSAEPKSINEMVQYGLRIAPVKKGPDSVEYGIKFLQDMESIVIDDTRCPNAAREFMTYELEKDANGNFKAKFPDKNNHTIDAIRYALNDECMLYMEEQKKKKSIHPEGSMEYKVESHLEKLLQQRQGGSKEYV